MIIPFENTFAQLPEQFYAKLPPQPVMAPKLIRINPELAKLMGIEADSLLTPEGINILAGVQVPDGAAPLAMAYGGHQFGNWVPQLGDGRAILLGEAIGHDGIRRDIQLKGSGRTPFSRSGDGRAALGPVLREYVVSEAMAALGLPTTRALAAVTTGENVLRDSVEPGAILTRVAQSHIRVGTFQYHYARQDEAAVKRLSDYVISRHYPELSKATNPYLALIKAVVARQASLVAQWMQIGFIHGVMNTDNCSVIGETIDFGPCAFMDTFHPGKVFSSIDHMGRYAWRNQPNIAQWNLAQFAQTLLPLLDEDDEKAVEKAQEALSTFNDQFSQDYYGGFGKKLGFMATQDDDPKFIEDTLELLTAHKVDFTLFFRHLTSDLENDNFTTLSALFSEPTAFLDWVASWKIRIAKEGMSTADRMATMQAVNPIFIPRNHRIEEMIQAALTGDYEPFERLLKILSLPFTSQPEHADYETPPKPDEIIHETFCGT
ncbi:MAG: YdiU family protein [Rhodospirillales bacterium]|nr:YdiU family protein [Rhodospirillales bacterium]